MAEKIERMELDADSKDKVYSVLNYSLQWLWLLSYWNMGHDMCAEPGGASRTLQFPATFDCWIKCETWKNWGKNKFILLFWTFDLL
jgi:hypothetical protein